MASFRRRLRGKAPITSDKHEVTWSNLGEDAGTSAKTVNLSNCVQMNAKNASTEVVIGAHVRAIYLEFHFSPAQTGNANVIHWRVEVLPSGLTGSNPNTYYQTDRRFTLKRGMEMLPVNVATVFKRIILVRIPRKYQRQSEGQIIRFRYQASSTQTINACGFAIYKEIY